MFLLWRTMTTHLLIVRLSFKIPFSTVLLFWSLNLNNCYPTSPYRSLVCHVFWKKSENCELQISALIFGEYQKRVVHKTKPINLRPCRMFYAQSLKGDCVKWATVIKSTIRRKWTTTLAMFIFQYICFLLHLIIFNRFFVYFTVLFCLET